MSLLLVNDLKRHYGATEVLRGANLRIEPGDKIGVVGRNGAGKTTLLRILEGLEEPDAGTVQLARGARLGYVKQRPDFAPGMSARGYVATGLDEVHAVERELEQCAEEMGRAEGEQLERAMLRHDELSQRMEFLGGWDTERRVEAVLSGIGLSEHLWDRDAATLSGGEKSRAALARELVATPDLLLLDEPTNHLDLVGIEWLEEYIKELKGAVLIVSHDRRLLDRAAGAIVELEFGQLKRYPGNYTRYVALRQERFAAEHKAWSQQQDMLRRETSFIKKHMGSQRTAEAKGRQKKLSHVVRLPQPHNDVRKPTIKLASAERGGELVIEGIDLAAGYDGEALFTGLGVRVGRGERIGIVGPNGAGKTTLLKVLAGRMQAMAGEISWGHKARCGFFDQEVEDLDETSTPYETIRLANPHMVDLEIRSHLARFLFRGPEVEAVIGTLSGGECARLYLARLVLENPSWLAFDEPTNHLDLAARTALEEFLGEFGGALLTVSHDREFLDGLCNTILEVTDDGVRRFRGNYSDYRVALKAEQEEREARANQREADKKKAAAAQRKAEEKRALKQGGKQRGGKQAGKPTRQRPRNPYQFKRLEEAIIKLEERKEALMAELATEAVYRDADKARDAQFQLAEVERDLEEKNAQWEEWAAS